MKIERLPQAESTNTLMRDNAARYAHGDVLIVDKQTAGRGQRGNSWEAEPGKNLTFSLMLRPGNVPPAQAYSLSMAVSLGVVDALRKLTALPVMIKWPNDIYVGNRKLAGILIENSFGADAINNCVVGMGININQTRFMSDAPNPVSLAMLCDRDFDLDLVLKTVVESVLAEVEVIDVEDFDAVALTHRYRHYLWRGTGVWPWRDMVRGEDIDAAIASVAPSGHLTLATNPPRTYAFKELAAIL